MRTTGQWKNKYRQDNHRPVKTSDPKDSDKVNDQKTDSPTTIARTNASFVGRPRSAPERRKEDNIMYRNQENGKQSKEIET